MYDKQIIINYIKNNVIKLLDLLYKDSELYLERKYNKYLEITKL